MRPSRAGRIVLGWTLCWCLIWAASAAASVPQEAYEGSVSSAGPVAMLPFADAAASPTIEDIVSSHVYTAANSGVTLAEEGPFAGARSGNFNGESSYATLPSDPFAGASEFTAEGWVQWNGGSTFGGPVFDFGSSATNHLFLSPASSAKEHPTLFEIHTSAGASVTISAPKPAAKAWQYVVITETSGGTLTLYLNGKQSGEAVHTTISPASLGSVTTALLGKSLVSGEGKLNAHVSDLAFYTTALSAAQVEQHFRLAEMPYATALPTISGTPKEGSKLKVKEGTWSGQTPMTTSYRWQRCKAGSCETVGTSATEYEVQPEDVGYTISVIVKQENAQGQGEATSAQTETATGVFPKNKEKPSVTGYGEAGPRDGQLLSANVGVWTGAPPLKYSYYWEICPPKHECSFAPGENNNSTYRVTSAEIGDGVAVLVVDETRAGSLGILSSPSPVVIAGPPTSATAPEISGEARQGEVLSASTGSWYGTAPFEYSYAWHSCDSHGTCHEGSGSTYTLGEADVGDTVTVEVTAHNAQGSATAGSTASAVVLGLAPVQTEAPSIEGEAREGQTLTAKAGAFSGTKPISYAYQWERCLGSSCSVIAGATGTTYTLAGGDVSATIQVAVKATNAFGSAAAVSSATGTVVGNPPHALSPPAVEGEAHIGKELHAAGPGSWQGTPTIEYVRYTWLRCGESSCAPIAGASGVAATSYTLVAGDVGSRIELEVEAKNPVGSGTAISSPTALVAGEPPINTVLPAITGEAIEGQTLKASPGTWSGAIPITYAYSWSCGGEACAGGHPEGHESEYTVARGDVGKAIELTVTATNSDGSQHASATPTTEAQALGGTAVAWGENVHGQLGQIYKDSYALSPVTVEGFSRVTEVAAANSFNLVLLADGTVRAFGGDSHGQLGIDSHLANWEEGVGNVQVHELISGTHEHLSEFPMLKNVKAVAAAGEHALALMKNGTVKTWGVNMLGALGNGTQGFEVLTNVNERLARTVEWPAIEKTEEVHTSKETRTRTIEVSAGKLEHIVAIATGGGSNYALTSEHTIEAWGSDTEGQLGLELGEAGPEGCRTAVTKSATRTEACSTVPRLVKWTNPATGHVETLTGVKAIAGGEFATYALLENGHLLSWGANHNGELGTGAPIQGAGSSEVGAAEVVRSSGEPLTNVVEVVAGYDDALARVETGGHEEVFGWGSSEQGALTLAESNPAVANCRANASELKKIEERIPHDEETIVRVEKELAEAKERGVTGEELKKYEQKVKTAKSKLKEDEHALTVAPIPCVSKATALPELEALHPAQLGAGHNFGLALSGGHVYSWGRNEHGELGIDKSPKNKEEGETEPEENVKEAGYLEPKLVHGFGSAAAVSAGFTHSLVLVEAGAAVPSNLVSLTAKHLALKLAWASHNPIESAAVEATHLNYKLSTRVGEQPVGEGSDPGNETGPPVSNPEEPPTIIGVEEGAAPVVETTKHTLKARHGSWGGTRPIEFLYQWERCNAAEEECVPVDKNGNLCTGSCATSFANEILAAADVGDRLRVTVIGQGPEYPEEAEDFGEATSEATAVVVLNETETTKPTSVNKSELTSPFEFTETHEQFSGFTRSAPLVAKPYELKLTMHEAVSETRKNQALSMIATPLE